MFYWKYFLYSERLSINIKLALKKRNVVKRSIKNAQCPPFLITMVKRLSENELRLTHCEME